MSTLASKAEILKLSRLLGAEPGGLSFLESFDPLAIRALREQMTAVLFDADRGPLQRIAAMTKVTPVPIAAVIAEKAMGPLLSAKVSALLPADKAIDISRRLPSAFLAEVCLHLDPRRTADIIRGTPVRQVVEVAELLLAREEYVTMARFVDALSPEAIKAVIEATPDEEALLRIGFFVETPARLNDLVSFLPKVRLQRMIEKSAASAELWPEALGGMVTPLEAHWRAEYGIALAGLDEATQRAMVASTQQNGLWPEWLALMAAAPAAAQAKMLGAAALQSPNIWAAMAEAARDAKVAPALDALKPQMPAAMRERIFSRA